jgi:phytoene synthase
MCAVYAFARRIDDIGDDPGSAEEKGARLHEQMRLVERLRAGEAPDRSDPVLVALDDARRRFPLPLGALSELIEGVLMDVEGETYETFEELTVYCRRVAGTIGRLCLAIFGLRTSASADAAEASRLADELGIALQLTNILRDVREDATNGRVYLPAEDLRRFGIVLTDAQTAPAVVLEAIGRRGEPGSRLDQLVAFEADRAREWFARGMALAPLLDRRSAACLFAMAGIYRRLLERIDADPHSALGTRMSLPATEKARVAVRGLLGVGV